jgi:hypothetical protein
MVTTNITVSYRNWDVRIYDRNIIFKCTLTDGFTNRQFVREYDIPSDTREILFEMPYIRLDRGKELTEFKCEGESFIIGDVWEDGEVVDHVAMHDFWDEWED